MKNVASGWARCTIFGFVIFILNLPLFATTESSYLSGWTASPTQAYTPAQMVADGARCVTLYTDYYDDMTVASEYNTVRDYLNTANDNGLKVILGVNSLVKAGDMSGLALMVDAFKNYPAVMGWLTYDEPNGDTVLADCQEAASIIRARSSKPIYIYFCRINYDSTTLDPVTFKDTYDVLMYDHYPWQLGRAEFYGLDDIGSWHGWISRFNETKTWAAAAGDKPFRMVVQGVGDDATFDFRLPTYAEERFMSIYSLMNGASGLEMWSAYRVTNAVAHPEEPYPYDGWQWTDDVAAPIFAEINELSPAILSGEVVGGVSDNKADIQSKIYLDPASNTYYLFTLNETSGSETVTFTFDLPVEVYNVVPQYEVASSIAVVNNQFTDNFSDYGVHVYLLDHSPTFTLGVTPSVINVGNVPGIAGFYVTKTGTGTMNWSAVSDCSWLTISSGASGSDEGTITVEFGANTSDAERSATIRVTAPDAADSPVDVTIVQAGGAISGDANGDGLVDVGDLGILAANYGTTTGATWSLGDFNGDEKVDVGDLGILAANYGTGTSGVDWDADYAEAFGETVSDDEADNDNGSTLCSMLGLPLIAGLALLGLMLVKWDK